MQCLQYGVFNGSDVCATCGQSQVVESFSPPLLQELLSSDLDLESVKRTSSQFFRKTVLGLRFTFSHVAYALIACKASIDWADDGTKFLRTGINYAKKFRLSVSSKDERDMATVLKNIWNSFVGDLNRRRVTIRSDLKSRIIEKLSVHEENSAKAKRKEEDKKAKVHVESINLV